MSRQKILIYGCIAKPHTNIDTPLLNGWKTRLKMARDRLLWATGSTAMLDYRNYDAPYPSNMGDVAIAEAVRNQLRSQLPEVEFTNLNWGELGTIDEKVLELDHSMIVIAGSGYFFVNNCGTLSPRIEQDLLVLERIRTPVVLFGVGVNWLFHPDNSECDYQLSKTYCNVLKRYFLRVVHASVRDPTSQRILSHNTGTSVSLLCDPALFLQLRSENSGVQTFSTNSTKPPRIGINFPFHGALTATLLKKDLHLYVKILRRLNEETGCSFHYFVHYHSECMIPRLFQDKRIDVEIVEGNPYHLSKRYREMDLHIGGMLHSCILAVGAGTPCVLLAYDVKHRGFAELFDLTPHCHDAMRLNPDAIVESVQQILADEILWRQRIDRRLSELWKAQQQFVKSCVSLGQGTDCGRMAPANESNDNE